MPNPTFPKVSAGILLAGLLLLSACAPAPVDDGKSLVGTSWKLDTMGDQKTLGNTTITLSFGLDRRLQVSGGCNHFYGEFTTIGDALTIQPLESTLIACEEPVMKQDSSFLQALQDAKHFAVGGDRLTLSDEAGVTQLVFAAQPEELAGSAWVVTGYNDGKQAVMSVLEDTDAELSFGDDGALEGTGGCNRFQGEYVAKDGILDITNLMITEMGCTEPAGVMEQEAGLFTALGSATAYAVEGSELRLTTVDDATAVTLTQG